MFVSLKWSGNYRQTKIEGTKVIDNFHKEYPSDIILAYIDIRLFYSDNPIFTIFHSDIRHPYCSPSLKEYLNISDYKVRFFFIRYKMFASCDRDGDGTLTVEEFIRGSKSNPVFMKLLMDYVK